MIGPTRRRTALDPEAGRETQAPAARRVPAPVGADPVAVGRRLRNLPPAERAAETRRLQRAYGNRWVAQATAPRPLPPDVRARMEGAFGSPLGDVVVSEGPEAESIDAAALTSGNRIVFHPGVYDPHSAEGLEVLGHELAHVLQQRAGRVPGAGVNEDPALEAEADRAGERVARGEHVDVAAGPVCSSEGSAVVQPMRLPWSRREPSASPGAPEPAHPDVEWDRLHELAQQKLALLPGMSRRGDAAGVQGVIRDLEEIGNHIASLTLIRSGMSPDRGSGAPSALLRDSGAVGEPVRRTEDDYGVFQRPRPLYARSPVTDEGDDAAPPESTYAPARESAYAPARESPYAPARESPYAPARESGTIGAAAAAAHRAIDELVRARTNG